jgi:uncharacterized protein (TIGR03437 family)
MMSSRLELLSSLNRFGGLVRRVKPFGIHNAIPLAWVLLGMLAIPAEAAHITYTINGILTGNLNGTNINRVFTWVAVADTSNIKNPAAGSYNNTASASYLTVAGLFTNLPTGQVTVSRVNNVITFRGQSGGITTTNAAYTAWNMDTPLAFVANPNGLLANTVITTPANATLNVNSVAVPGGTTVTPGFQASTAPFITSIENAASNLGVNNPLAQGAIVVIKGAGLGPSTIAVAPGADIFQKTSLSGTSVSIAVGSTTVNALMYYTSSSQVAFLIPSTVPVNTGTTPVFTLTYNGQSATFSRGITSSSVGIFTVDSSGEGPALVTFPDYSLVSAAKNGNCGPALTACGAANPGDTLIVWATGMGPVQGSDAAGAGLGQNMPDVPLKLFLGGVQQNVVYQGRSGCCIGEDQIAFTVSDKTPLGCAVPMVIQIGDGGNAISNFTTLPVAAKGQRDCPPVNPAYSAVNRLVVSSAVQPTFADIRLSKTSDDDFQAQFGKILGFAPGTAPFFMSWVDDIPAGTCLVFNRTDIGLNAPVTGFSALNAGPTVTVRGPSGTGTASYDASSGQYSGVLSPTAKFLVPGVHTVSGSGGPDVGAFSASITIPPDIQVLSPGDASSVTRSAGFPVSWSGGGSGTVVIQVLSPLELTATVGKAAYCIAPAAGGSFTVPSYVMLSLFSTDFAGFTVGPYAKVPVTASGLNVGTLSLSYDGIGFGYRAGRGSFSLK